ncbi:MAG: DNA cytosine methyltransferase [Desulfovibrio sp.]|jgi:DNA (cytosine-5)-methyltransferase 1|nr:DNA cytosine methyltransferase [Desulfovibrio sp.]
MLNYLSVTSGIAADTVAWGPLGWQCVAYAEIEPFPCAVLDYQYGCGAPEVMPSPLCAKTHKEAKRLEAMLLANAKLPPRAQGCPPNLGDIRSVTGARIRELLKASGLGHLNILMGGTPCQDFSVAGLRAGLTGDRGNLALEFVRIADECDPDAAVLENVPGLLSDANNAFGNFLSALAGADFPSEPGPRPPMGKSNKFWRWSRKRGRHDPKWPDAGWVTGPKRTVAWRILDAQYFGLAQRRRRLFAVGCPLGGADPRAILFEREGLRRDTPPSRQAQTAVAGAITRSAYSGGLGGRPEGAAAGHFIPHNETAGSLSARFGRNGGTANDDLTGHRLVTGPLTNIAGERGWSINAEQAASGHLQVTHALTGRLGGGGPDDNKAQGGFYVTCALSGRINRNSQQDSESGMLIAYPLRAQSQSAHDESLENYVAHALRADGFDASENGTGRGTPLVAAIAIRGRKGGCNVEMRTDGLANTVLTPSGGRAGIGVGAILRESAVRRLLPLECELLMGLPPGYTLIPFGRAVKAEKMEPDYADFLMQCGCLTLEDACRAAADGPRYKSHGNSIAIPSLRWLGERIEKVLLPVLYPELFGVQEEV